MKAGQKIILNQKQQKAAQIIFGDDLAAAIIASAQKQIDGLASAAADLKAAVARFDARLTSYERTKGIDISNRFYQANGKPADDLTAAIFRSVK